MEHRNLVGNESKEFEADDNNGFWMGKNAPLHWILIYILIIPAMLFVGIISAVISDIKQELRCKNHVGEYYVYDMNCYRLLDNGGLQYVDVELELKIRDARERMKK